MRAAVSKRVIAVGFLCLLLASAAPALRSWNKIRYQGGTVDVKVNPFDWNTTLSLRDAEIELFFAGRKRIVIPRSEIVAVSYRQAAYRRAADLSAFRVMAAPLPLFGLLHKSKDHVVGIEFKEPDGKQGLVLLVVNKDSHRDLLDSLQAFTAKPVENWP